jgi:hypothetical protein
MTRDEKHAGKRSKQHTVYKNAAGQRVPGTTTITGVMDKPALVGWANGLGLRGINSREYVDELAVIGTLAHYLIECHCKEEEPDLGDATPNQLELAQNSVKKFLSWQASVGFVPEYNELQLVSEEHQYGGQIDIIGTINGRRALVDIKTCKGIYGEHLTQVAGGYLILCREHVDLIGPVDDVIIIRVGRNDDEGFEQVKPEQGICDMHMRRFLICRKLYSVNQEIGR